MKRICILCLIFLMLFSMQTNVWCTASKTDSAADRAYDFLASFDIMDKGEYGSNVSRAEFTDILVRALNYTSSAEEASEAFYDVGDNLYINAIDAALELGLISGDGNGLFYPDSPIVRFAAIKMAVAALGYTQLAIAYGDYPYGYIRIAHEIDLTKGMSKVSYDSYLTYEDASVLIYNFLNTDLCGVSKIKQDDISYVRRYGESPLSEYFHLTKVIGIVKAAGFATMIPGDETDHAKITIDSQTFLTELDLAKEYLGYEVNGWYDDKTNALNHIYITEKNETKTLSCEEVDDYKDFKIKVQSDGANRTEVYSLSRSFTFVKNGRNKVPVKADFQAEGGTLTLIDNNSDGKYDVVAAKSPRYMVVSKINLSGGVVYDSANGGKSVILDNDNGYYYSLHISDKKGNLLPAVIDDLATNMVMMVYESEDGKYVEAIASSLTISGNLEEIGADYIAINGEEYTVNSGFGDTAALVPGYEYDFLLAADGTVTSVLYAQTGTMKYGYLVDFHSKTSGLTPEVYIKLLSCEGKLFTAELAEKITLDGIYMRCTDERISSIFLNGTVPAYQVVKYMLNKEGMLSKIDTAYMPSDNATAEEKYTSDTLGDDALRLNYKGNKSYWHATFNVFSPHAAIGENTVIFNVPKDIYDKGVAVEKKDEKYFSVITRKDLPQYSYEYSDAYDMDEYMQPAVLVRYDSNAGSNINVEQRNLPAMVERVSEGWNSEGVETKIFTLWYDGKYCKYTLSNNLNFIVNQGTMPLPNSGDIIRMAVDSFGEIQGYEIDVRYDAKTDTLSFTSETPSSGQLDNSYYIGKAYACNGNALSLMIDRASGFSEGYTTPIQDDIASFTITSECKIAVYNLATKTVRQGKFDLLADVASAGEIDASRIVVKSYTHGVEGLFIYQ